MKTEERIELKHLSPYLPYGLKCWVMGEVINEGSDVTIPKEFDIVGASTVWIEIYEIGRTVTEQFSFEDVKPLLHPLSRLTDEHIGELEGCHNFSSMSYSDIKTDPTRYPFTIVQKLFEWHFDVFGLIDKGLAEPIELTDKD
jgi:hypothetical protein